MVKYMSMYDKYEDFLKPNEAKNRLLSISVFIAYYEYFTDLIIQLPESFYIDGFSEGKFIISDKYKESVLSLDKNKINASLLWLKSIDCIDDADYETFHSIRKFRNKLTHEMLQVIFDNDHERFNEYYKKMIELMLHIHKWWIIEIELPTSDFDPNLDIDSDDVISGTQLIMNIYNELLFGKEEDAAKLYYDFIAARKDRESIDK